METADQAYQHVAEMLKANASEEGTSALDELIKLFNIGDQEGVIKVVNGLVFAERRQTMVGMLHGDMDAAVDATGNAIFIAMLVGYRLGCSHTAERVSLPKISASVIKEVLESKLILPVEDSSGYDALVKDIVWALENQ